MNREDFPLLADGKWAYLDNAATTQRPQPVLDALAEAAVTCNANVHRSPHGLGREMTRRFEEARDKVGRFFGASEHYTVVFTSGATGAINLVAHSYLEAFCQPGDRILTLGSEHHSNFVPWQQLCKRQGLDFQVVPILPGGQPDWSWFRQALSPATKLVALAHVTNTFGVVNPVEEVIRLAHERGIPVLVDGAQAAGHRPVDVERLRLLLRLRPQDVRPHRHRRPAGPHPAAGADAALAIWRGDGGAGHCGGHALSAAALPL